MTPTHPSAHSSRQKVIFLAGLLFVSLLAVCPQSLWIDEANTALKAQQTTFQNWWAEMLHTGGSDMQMPLYMIWIWAFGKLVGTGEVALRAVNLFWILPGLIALWFALGSQPRLQLAVFLATICNPFVWYYMNEARPYAMQIGASLMLGAALCHWSQKPSTPARGESIWVWVFVVALVALSGASMLGMIWAGAAVLAAIWLTPKERLIKLGGQYWIAWLAALILLAGLGLYFLWTLQAGARASAVASTDWKNVAFVGYELLGFAGLGPGRLEIRDGGLAVFKRHVIALGLFAGLVFALLGFAVRDLLKYYPRKKLLGLAVIVLAPAAVILAAGLVLHFRVLGRHFAPLLVVVVLIMGLGISAAWRSMVGKILVVGFLTLCLTSGLLLRSETRHARDDYRTAATLARTALSAGKSVWWSADINSAAYYQLPLATNLTTTGKAFFAVNLPENILAGAVPADVVIISRKDLYDPNGVLAGYLARNSFRQSSVLPAFVIWEK